MSYLTDKTNGFDKPATSVSSQDHDAVKQLSPNTLAFEVDPNGKDQHSSGAKLDAGKPRPALVLGGFARALGEVTDVGTYGANKYTDNGWMEVPDGVSRYTEAMMRHMLAEQRGELQDKDTKLKHAAHLAWNALARLDLMIREEEQEAANRKLAQASQAQANMEPDAPDNYYADRTVCVRQPDLTRIQWQLGHADPRTAYAMLRNREQLRNAGGSNDPG